MKGKKKEKIILSCKNIFLEVKNNVSSKDSKYIRLIDNLSVNFYSGDIIAIMGSSGCGKTSFINTLVGRINSNAITSGSITLFNKVRNEKNWVKSISYLEQDDYIVNNQTVREFILFSVECKRCNRSSKENIAIVDSLINEMGLYKIKDTKLNSISGGERKRVMIAVEFAIEPDIVILDEPTTGLDSHTAMNIVMKMKEYAKAKNKIVIMSIHQPGSGLYFLFDKILYLHKGDKFYYGPPAKVNKFLKTKGFNQPKKLSEPEFLFEIFSTNPSIYPNIEKSKKKLSQIMEKKNLEKKEKKINMETSGSSYSYVNLRLHIKQSLNLVKRKLTLDLRSGNLYKKMIIYTTMLFVILNLQLRVSAKALPQAYGYISDIFEQANWTNIYHIMNNVLVFDRSKYFGFMIRENIINYSMIYILTSDSLYDNDNILERELKNYTYSISSLVFGNIMYIFFNILLVVPFSTFLFYIIGITPVLSPSVLFLNVLILFSHDVTKSAISSISSSVAINRLLFFLFVVLTFIGFFNRFQPIYSFLCTNPMIQRIIHLRYIVKIFNLIFIFPSYYIGCYFLSKYIGDYIKPDIYFDNNVLHQMTLLDSLLVPKGNKKTFSKIASQLMSLFYSEKQSIHLVIVIGSALCLLMIFLQVFFISYRLSPKIRLSL